MDVDDSKKEFAANTCNNDLILLNSMDNKQNNVVEIDVEPATSFLTLNLPDILSYIIGPFGYNLTHDMSTSARQQ